MKETRNFQEYIKKKLSVEFLLLTEHILTYLKKNQINVEAQFSFFSCSYLEVKSCVLVYVKMRSHY